MGDTIYILLHCEVDVLDFKLNLQPLCKAHTYESNDILYVSYKLHNIVLKSWMGDLLKPSVVQKYYDFM